MAPNDNQDISTAEFAQFQKLIYKIAGISLADSKKVLLVGRLGRRIKHYKLSSFGEYYRLVSSGTATDELQIMVDLLTTNETYFFREAAHFEFLTKTILGGRSTTSPFSIWSAASSTGEEIYTLAFVLADTLGLDAPWSITGSDISTSVLATAERGLYWLDRTRGLPQSYLRKYCLKGVRSQEGGFMIAPEIKRHTKFLQVNLNQSLPAAIGKFNVIFLRNVMIYFDAETKRQVVSRLVEKLHPGGYFIVGHSESLNGLTDSLRVVKPTIYQLPE
ncbi:MAG: SAM-dependent methyltransferase [Burkholderiaceae bacterium]|nr:SAM-dependent methyltransferase [Sulfuritalea sp.]MCF8174096.1 SAM-dependent methyltransferase [Burkholderiaceae bacterium]MCF8184384.1 SAM-dependent methyltransferase [Polynucleobacter sp.]